MKKVIPNRHACRVRILKALTYLSDYTYQVSVNRINCTVILISNKKL